MSNLPCKRKNADESEEATDAHAKDPKWSGWDARLFGLEMQKPWAEALLDGRKTIETRAYDLPRSLLGKRIEILESTSVAGVSSLGNMITGGDSGINQFVKRIGWCIFDRVIKYQDEAAFDADEEKHLVKKECGYGWRSGETKIIFGWAVKERGRYTTDGDKPSEPPRLMALVRRMRSLFELHPLPLPGRQTVSSGTKWEDMYGYSRAVRTGDSIFVSGTTASTPDGLPSNLRGDAAGQARFALDKIRCSIEELGGTIDDVVRTRIFVAKRDDFVKVVEVHGEVFGDIKPCNTSVIAELVGEDFLVEIEADAIVGSRRTGRIS